MVFGYCESNGGGPTPPKGFAHRKMVLFCNLSFCTVLYFFYELKLLILCYVYICYLRLAFISSSHDNIPVVFQISMEFNFANDGNLVFLGSSSLMRCINSSLLSVTEKHLLKTFCFGQSGLSFKPEDPVNAEHYLNDQLKNFTRIIIWHDLINNSITNHPNPQKNNPPVYATTLVATLNNYKDRIAAIVYCNRERSENIYNWLKDSDILILNATTHLCSNGAHHEPGYVQSTERIHPEHTLELLKIQLLLKHGSDLKRLLTFRRNRSQSKKKLSKSRRQRNNSRV